MEINGGTVVKWLTGLCVLLCVTIDVTSMTIDNNPENASAVVDLTETVRLLKEQVNALIRHRQQDYNALEESLKSAMEKNTELIVLRNQVRQLRKEVNDLGGGSGNEAKNERLRVKWLGSAVTELRSEVAEVLRTRNTSEAIAQRSKMQSEIALLKGDVAEVGRGIRDLGGRLAKLEAALGTVRLDIFAVKERTGQLTRICADVTSQLSTVQIEMKSMKCSHEAIPESPTAQNDKLMENVELLENQVGEHNEVAFAYLSEKRKAGESGRIGTPSRKNTFEDKYRTSRYWKTHRVEERLSKLEHKIAIVARKRGVLEKRVVYENDHELKGKLEEVQKGELLLATRITKMSEDVSTSIAKADESIIRLFESMENLTEKMEKQKSEEKREVGKLETTAARKYAELSIVREELVNLRRTVQALSVSASKLQEKSDSQQESLKSLRASLDNVTKLRDFEASVERATKLTAQLEHVEDDYRSMVETLPGNCEERDGLTLLGAGALASPLLVSCHKGWIVIGRRIDGMIDFDKSWREYAEGFGSPVNEFWLGNEALHRLTRDNCTSLRIDLTDIYGTRWRAEYENFHVASEETGYKLSVSGFAGNATDALSYQNGMAFSAKDRDMDISSADCAANYRGGWWFSHCQHANLNGKYSLGLAWYRSDTNQWMAVASSVMSIQRKPQCSLSSDSRVL